MGDFHVPQSIAIALLAIGILGYVYVFLTWAPVLRLLARARKDIPVIGLGISCAIGAILFGLGFWFLVPRTETAQELPGENKQIREAIEAFIVATDEYSGKEYLSECMAGHQIEGQLETVERLATTGIVVSDPVKPYVDIAVNVLSSPLYLPSEIPQLRIPRRSYMTVHQRLRGLRSMPLLRVCGNSERRIAFGLEQVTDRRPIDALRSALSEAERASLPGGESERRGILRYQFGQFLMRGGMEEQTIHMLLQPTTRATGGPIDPSDQLGKVALRVQQWQLDLITFVQVELGDVYVARLSANTRAKARPSGLHMAFWHSWDVLTNGLAKVEEFLTELPEIPLAMP